MLQIRRSGLGPENIDVEPASDFGLAGQSLAAAQALVWRQLPVMLFVLVLALALGAIFYLTTPPRYTATGTLIIDSRKSQVLQQQSPSSVWTCLLSSPTVDSQVEVLKSETIALAVIKELRLTDEPEFTGGGGGLIGTAIGAISRIVRLGYEIRL